MSTATCVCSSCAADRGSRELEQRSARQGAMIKCLPIPPQPCTPAPNTLTPSGGATVRRCRVRSRAGLCQLGAVQCSACRPAEQATLALQLPSLPTGAYLTEGGVHFVAALRMMAGAAGWGQTTAVVACARGISPNLPHPDTLQGLVWFESGEWGLGVWEA